MESTHFISLLSAVLAWVAAGAVLFRDRSSLAGKLFAVGMLLLGGEALIQFVAFRQTDLPSLLRWQELRYVPTALIPPVWIAFSMVYSRGNYREYLRGNRRLLAAAAAIPLLALLAGHSELLFLQPNPDVAGEFYVTLGWSAQLIHFIMIMAAVIILKNLEQTFWSSVGTQRWKIKLVMIAISGLFVVRIYTSSQLVLYRSPSGNMALLNGFMLIVACCFIALSVYRTRGFSIDLYPSQTALHRSIIVIMAGIYLIVIGLLARLAAFLGGEGNFQLRALVIMVGLVLLAMLLMSDRVREQSRAWINRYFNRPNYNYREVWAGFTRIVARAASPEALCQATSKWIAETLDALSITVWLVSDDQRDLVLAGATVDPEKDLPKPDRTEVGAWTVVVQSALHLKEPVNLDRAQNEPVGSLARLQPRMFKHNGDRLAVPLISGDHSFGVIIIGDRINAVPFTAEDKELLVTIAEQMATELQARSLSRRLMEAREMEAFQSMSTFFVHDLKNTASSLSLMLQNLPRHFDNPEFRADALRSIQKSVHRINEMIQSLSALRQKLTLELAPEDLAQFVEDTASLIAKERGIPLESDMQPTGAVHMDRDQLGRVLTNLLVNAQQASAAGRPVRVETGREPGWAWFKVIDQGFGMTEEFIAHRLFRPFQTTKQQGTGIGLYHSKMIVDAHHGRMEVHSRQNVGTHFTVYLPLIHAPDEADRTDR